MKRQLAFGLGMIVVLSVRVSWAGGLGIPLDGFLQNFQTWVVGLGLIMGLVPFVVLVAALMRRFFAGQPLKEMFKLAPFVWASATTRC